MRSTYSNVKQKFSLLTRLLHWSIFILFTLQFFLVYRREYFPKNAPEKLQYILLHKSVGVLLLFIGLIFIIYQRFSQRPEWPMRMPGWQRLLAKLTHVGLFLMILLMPITGILMSMYGGRPISFFGQFTLPMLVAENKPLAGTFHEIHEYLSYFVIFLVSIHVLGALTHHFIARDRVLKSML